MYESKLSEIITLLKYCLEVVFLKGLYYSDTSIWFILKVIVVLNSSCPFKAKFEIVK